MWEAILGGHETVTKLLVENGATLQSGDVGQYACTAAEQNNLNLLQDIMRYGGDISLPSNTVGTTALHVAVSEDNVEIVKFLLENGANIDKPDRYGWTPRDLADQQGHVEIKAIFEAKGEQLKTQSFVAMPIPERQGGAKVRYLGRFTSEPIISMPQDGSIHGNDGSWIPIPNRPRRRTNNFHNSLFGIMSAATKGENDQFLSVNMNNIVRNDAKSSIVRTTRVTISCPEKGEVAGKLILLPESFEELVEIGGKKFGIVANKVVCKDGAEIDEIEVIRDGDHLIFVGDGGVLDSNCGTQCNGVIP